FRRWCDEPVSRAATERFTGRTLGAFAEARPCSEVPSLSLTVRWGQFPPLVERNKMLARRPRNRTGIDLSGASRAQFYEGRLWLSNLSTCRLPSILACSVEPNNESCKQSSRQLWKVAADVSLPSQCSRATRTQASQPRATRSPERSKSAFWKRWNAALPALSRFPTF